MIKFNPKNKKTLTYGESLGPAMEITDPKEAAQYFKDYVAFIQKDLDKNPNENGDTAEQIAKSNLGYWAGYYSHEIREQVEEVFSCAHPVFGSIKENGAPTMQEAFNAGMKLAKTKR